MPVGLVQSTEWCARPTHPLVGPGWGRPARAKVKSDRILEQYCRERKEGVWVSGCGVARCYVVWFAVYYIWHSLVWGLQTSYLFPLRMTCKKEESR